MIKFNRWHLILLISFCLIGFIVPFFTRVRQESFNSTISTSFTVVSALVSIITLIVAVILFDKFGINTKFKEKQLDTVLELVNELKLLSLTVEGGRFTYLNYIRKCVNIESFPKQTYNVDKTKTLLVPDNFEDLLMPIYKLYASPWLPKEIKDKINFINFIAVNHVNDFDYTKYVKINVNGSGTEPYMVTIPRFSFEMFSINLSILATTILRWIDDHANIKIDFDLIEARRP